MNACIFANGDLDFQPSLTRNSGNFGSCDYIIAADGGARHCLKLGIKPDLIIGDMDSIDSVTESALVGIEKVTFPKEKDRTDTACAIDEALKCNYSQATIFGGAGGRIDHTIGNFALVARHTGKVALATKDGLLIGLGPSQKCRLNGPIGSIVSIVVWGESAGIQSEGLKYPLVNEVLETGSRGISNEISENPSCIHVITGKVLLFIGKSIRFYLTHPGKTGNDPG